MLFEHLINLESIYLDNNDINSIDNAALFLQNNQLSTSMDLSQCYRLSNIDLSHNMLTEIPKFNVTNSCRINLSHNNISHLNITDLVDNIQLSQSSLIISLDLSHNSINTINFTNFFRQKWNKPPMDYVTFNLIVEHNELIRDCDIFKLSNYIPIKIFFKLNQITESVENNTSEANDLQCPFDECPEKCTCLVNKSYTTLKINCSNLNLTTVPVLPHFANDYEKFADIELYLENNAINALTYSYGNITKIFARNNKLSVINLSNLPPELIVLDLRANTFTQLDTIVAILNKSSKIEHLMLSKNAWQCNCNDSTYIQSHTNLIPDYDQIECANQGNKKLNVIPIGQLCEHNLTLVIICVATVSIAALIFAATVSLYLKYNVELKVWLYANNFCMRWIRITEEPELDKAYEYDAFLSYSHKDIAFVLEIMNKLENDPYNLKLCLHDRDWMPGEYITDSVSFFLIFVPTRGKINYLWQV